LSALFEFLSNNDGPVSYFRVTQIWVVAEKMGEARQTMQKKKKKTKKSLIWCHPHLHLKSNLLGPCLGPNGSLWPNPVS
jgi:hypothetical protein